MKVCESCGRFTSGKRHDGIVACSRGVCLTWLDEENDRRQAWARRIISEWPMKVILRAIAAAEGPNGGKIEIEHGPTLLVRMCDLRAELSRRTDGLLN